MACHTAAALGRPDAIAPHWTTASSVPWSGAPAFRKDDTPAADHAAIINVVG